MWEERAYRARSDISALAASGLGVCELHAESIRVISRAVRAELTCLAAIDPETLVISSMTSGDTGVPPEYEPLLAEAEYSTHEPNTFASLARRGELVSRLSDLPARERGRSARLNNVWRPLGLDRDLRVTFMADGACWGAAGMVRAGSDFTEREAEYLAAVAPAVGAATRLAVRCETRNRTFDSHPAIVVVGARGDFRAATPAAQEWERRIDEIAPGRFTVMMHVMAAGARAGVSGSFRARLRDARGQWAVLQATPLIGGEEEQIAVSIEPATGEQMIGLLVAAYALTSRERDICREVIAGYSTVDIAGRLFISANTVQDHLKSVFLKVGVRSRGELVARLRPDGPAPRAAEGQLASF